ncbi:MAG TPA: biotin transporter BioY [Aeromicrobium sp.]|nr:biotin transporter BioY [Aeromicrobium sp.]
MSEATKTETKPANSGNHVGTDIALISVFAAFVAVCAQFSLPFSVNGVEFSLQPFAVFLAGAVLGARRGFLAIVLYLVVGAAGLPVFLHGTGGIAAFTGATAGYLITFPIVALLVGLAVERTSGWARPVALFLAGLLGIGINLLAGALSVSLVLDTAYWPTVKSLAVFVPADILKLGLAGAIALVVHRAFPQLLGKN